VFLRFYVPWVPIMFMLYQSLSVGVIVSHWFDTVRVSMSINP
jgi:hypothetical protein